METITWNPEFSVGNDHLDRQHQRIITTINRLIEERENSQLVSETLTAMAAYAKTHFKDEEELMKKYDFANFESQKEVHRKYINKTLKLCQDVLDNAQSVPEDMLAFLSDWWVSHILYEDLKYRGLIPQDAKPEKA